MEEVNLHDVCYYHGLISVRTQAGALLVNGGFYGLNSFTSLTAAPGCMLIEPTHIPCQTLVHRTCTHLLPDTTVRTCTHPLPDTTVRTCTHPLPDTSVQNLPSHPRVHCSRLNSPHTSGYHIKTRFRGFGRQRVFVSTC